MTECIDGTVFIASLFIEIMFGNKKQLSKLTNEIITDNNSLYDSISSKKLVSEKRLRIDISATKEALKNGDIDTVTWVSTDKQYADCLTKAGASPFKLLEVIDKNALSD